MDERGRPHAALWRKTVDMRLKTLENLARRMAKRQGHVLTKVRRRDPFAVDYGSYRLENHGVVLLHSADLKKVMRVLTHLEFISAGTERGLEIMNEILQAAGAAGWRALPPDGGTPMPLGDAIPRLFKDFAAAVNNDKNAP